MRKGDQVLRLLRSHPSIQGHLRKHPQCDIFLKPGFVGPVAEIKTTKAGVQVGMAAFFFDKYDIGYVAGMFCHEFGIHPIGSAAKNVDIEEKGFKDTPYKVPGFETKTMKAASANQPSHVFGAMPNTKRYEAYRRVVLEMAELLRVDVAANRGVREDVVDLLDCYLMDLASIAVSNDGWLRGLPYALVSRTFRLDVATAYNAYRDLLIAELEAKNPPLLNYLPEEKTAEAVEAAYSVLLTRAFAPLPVDLLNTGTQ